TPERIGFTPAGRLVLDGDVILPADGSTMNERRRVALYGLISVAVAVDARGKISGKPQIRLQGVPVEEERDDFVEEAVAAATEAVRKDGANREKLRETL